MELDDIERFHTKFDRIIAAFKLCTNRSKEIITILEERYHDFAMSDCESENEDEDEEETNFNKNFVFSTIPRTFDGLHTKIDGLIKMYESNNQIKKQNRFLESSPDIPLTVPGLDSKIDRVEEFFQIEKKKQERLIKVYYDYMMKNHGVDVRVQLGNLGAAAQVVAVVEEEDEDGDCVID